MEFCRIKPEESADVKNILSKLNQGDTTWNTIRQELRSPPISLSSTSLDDLQRFDWRGWSDYACFENDKADSPQKPIWIKHSKE